MEPIAIIGLGCLLPGANHPEQLWQKLLAEFDAISLCDHFDKSVDFKQIFAAKKGVPDKSCNLQGGWIKDFQFDPHGFALPPDKLAGLDSPYTYALYTAKQALQDSGYLHLDHLQKAAVILGAYSWGASQGSMQVLRPLYDRTINDYLPSHQTLQVKEQGHYQAKHLKSPGYIAHTVAEALALQGPAYAIDAACASSLYAFKLAIWHLLSNEVEIAIAGGVVTADPVFSTLGFASVHALPDGDRSRPLDSGSTGLAPAEGCCLFVLKKASAAQRDGDDIYALIRGIGLSNDGAGQHLLTPNKKGQVLACERAYQAAECDLADVDYIELHATGTELGDRTELASLQDITAHLSHKPYIGTIKSNIGHLLTAAGAASALKCIQAMQNNMIPATIGIQQPLAADQTVRTNLPWPHAPRAKRAAINAFGFGGTNAHMLLEEPNETDSYQETQAVPHVPLAITGMDAVFGPWQGIEEIAANLYAGKQAFVDIAPERWLGLNVTESVTKRGAYIESFDFDALRYRIPPHEIKQMNPAQLLMLKVADQAIQQAKLQKGSRVAVIIGMGFDLSAHRLHTRWCVKNQLYQTAPLEQIIADAVADSLHTPVSADGFTSYIGNILASRIAALWDFSGPAFTLSAEENTVMQALAVAEMMLANDEVEAVVLGGIDLALDPEQVFLLGNAVNLQAVNPSMSFEASMHGMVLGEGAGAIVLQKATAVAEEKVYAYIDSIVLHQPLQLDAAAVSYTANLALQRAKVTANEIDYIEANASGYPHQDEAELDGLSQVYHDAYDQQRFALGSVKSQVGHTQAASGIAALIHTALCLSQRYIPCVPSWRTAKNPELFAASSFYVAGRAYPWISSNKQRRAAINSIASQGSCAHVIMRGTTHFHALLTPRAAASSLIKLVGSNRSELIIQLEQMLAHPQAEKRDHHPDKTDSATFVLSLLANDAAKLREECQLALTALQQPQVISHWQTPSGSYYTENPLGQNGKICFVYPGINNCYPFLGVDFPHFFPDLQTEFFNLIEKMGAQFPADALYPRSKTKLDYDDIDQLEKALLSSAEHMSITTSFFAVLYTKVLKEQFNLPADGLLGYSAGESNLLMSNQIWDLAYVDQHPLPHIDSRLMPPYAAVSQYWQLPENTNVDWAIFYLLIDVHVVEAILTQYQYVYVTHINTPKEIIIAGQRQQCEEIIERLGCDAFEAPANLVMHCPPVTLAKEVLLNHFTAPCQSVNSQSIYLAHEKLTSLFSSTVIANSLYHGLTDIVNFPVMLNQAYEDGHRIFIEIGPGSSCTRWITENLAHRPHAVVTLNRRGLTERDNILRFLAVLCSHQVPLTADAWLASAMHLPSATTLLPTKIKVGGHSIPHYLQSHLSIKHQHSLVLQCDVSAATRDVTHLLTELDVRNNSHATWLTRETVADAYPLIVDEVKPRAVFSSADIMEFTEGKLANVFGHAFAEIDTYPVRLRLPSPPFLALSRVMALQAQPLSLEPGYIVTEFDVPTDAWYAVDGQVPFMAIDAQGILFLLSYVGVDLIGKGQWMYRWLNSEMQFFDEFPKAGDTIRYEIHLESFVQHDDALLCFSHFECRVKDKLVLRISNTCAGFFTQATLQQGKSLGSVPQLADQSATMVFSPLLFCQKNEFSQQDLNLLQRGEIAACFDQTYYQQERNPSLRLAPGPMLMIDRITMLTLQGGLYGLGYFCAEKDLNPNHWYMRNHFKDAPIFAGPCMLQAAIDMLQFFGLYIGLQVQTQDARFQMTTQPYKAIFRKQVSALQGIFSLRADIKAIDILENLTVIADVSLIYQDEIIGKFENLGIQLKEKSPCV
jgi:PfaB family protein